MRIVSLSDVSNAQAAEWLVDLADDLGSTDGDHAATVLISTVMVSASAWVLLDEDEPIAAFGWAPSTDTTPAAVWSVGASSLAFPSLSANLDLPEGGVANV